MTAWETFSGLSGNGDLVFALSGVVEVVRFDVTNFGQSNQVDQDATFPRFFKLGWWTFTDNTHALGQAATGPIYFIEFQHGRWNAPSGLNWYANGFHGIHYHLFNGVQGTFNVGES